MIPVDTHAHFHPGFDAGLFLDAAAQNFRSATASHTSNRKEGGALILTEGPREAAFERLVERAPSADWAVQPGEENIAQELRRQDGAHLLLVAGRQIVTREKLEVLALGSRQPFIEERPLADTIEAVIEAGALAVVPWGFGKWWGTRGRRVAEWLAQIVDDRGFLGNVFLGDNGCRPRWSSPPRLFTQAAVNHVRILPGSDPLPFVRHSTRAGSYGVLLASHLSKHRPAESLLAAFRDPQTRLTPYGSPRPLPAFVRDQLAMQIYKRWRRKTDP